MRNLLESIIKMNCVQCSIFKSRKNKKWPLHSARQSGPCAYVLRSLDIEKASHFIHFFFFFLFKRNFYFTLTTWQLAFSSKINIKCTELKNGKRREKIANCILFADHLIYLTLKIKCVDVYCCTKKKKMQKLAWKEGNKQTNA